MAFDTLFMNVKKLFDYELYSEVLTLASLIHTAFENDRTLLSQDQEYQMLMFEAYSHYYLRQFRQAESLFRQALLAKKALNKQKNIFLAQIEVSYENFNDAETKYRLAMCLHEIRQHKDSITVLQSITARQRNAKMNMLLAKLQHITGGDSVATMAYKDVLKECPLAIGAIKALLELGVNGSDVNSLIVNVSFSSQCSDWLSNWIKGHDLLYHQRFLEAAETFNGINQTSRMRNNELLLVTIGECFNLNGSTESALRYLSQAHMLKPQSVEGIMTLAVVYFKLGKIQELEKLAQPPITIPEHTTEHWFVLAQSFYCAHKFEKSAYFAQKAIHLNPRNAEAVFLRAKILFELKKYKESLLILRTVQSFAPHRFDVYKWLVKCYTNMNRTYEAQTMAAQAVRTMGQTPRTLVLLASTFLNDSHLKNKVKSLLNKALEMDESYYSAVLILSEILQAEGDLAGALRLLKKQTQAYPHCRLHTTIGDILARERDMDGALENYTMALNLDPSNLRALAGLNSMGHPTATNSKQDSSYVAASSAAEEQPVDSDSFDMIEISPAAADDAESESETLWSDVEVEVNPN